MDFEPGHLWTYYQNAAGVSNGKYNIFKVTFIDVFIHYLATYRRPAQGGHRHFPRQRPTALQYRCLPCYRRHTTLYTWSTRYG